MVLLVLTKPLQAHLEAITTQLPTELASQLAFYLTSSASLSTSETDSKSQHAPKETIDHSVIIALSKWARKGKKEDYYLSALLKLTNIYAPPLPVREKSPALLQILSTVQKSQDAASYASMTSLEIPKYRSLLPLNDVHESRTGVKTVAEEWGEVRREVGAIVNVGASMIAVGVAVWWVGGGRSNAARLGLSMAGSFAIGVIEGFLYWRYFTREQQQSEAGKRALRKSAQNRVPKFEGSLLSFEGVTKLGMDGKETY